MSPQSSTNLLPQFLKLLQSLHFKYFDQNIIPSSFARDSDHRNVMLYAYTFSIYITSSECANPSSKLVIGKDDYD